MIGITGSEGYIGSSLREKLTEEDTGFIGIDLKNGEDIVDYSCLQENLGEVDTVIHLAALSGVGDCNRNSVEAVRSNIRGTTMVATFCENNDKRLVFSSSFATDRGNLYGETKRVAEEIIRSVCDDYLIFKMSNVYGGEKNTVVNIFIDKWANGEPLPVHKPGTQVRDFIHLSDVVDAYIKASESNYTGKIDLVSGNVISINQLAEYISGKRKFVDRESDDEVFFLETSTDDLEKIGFKPSISIKEGIEIEKNEKENTNLRK